MSGRPHTGRLMREVDVSGVSGVGHVADVCLWLDGTAAVRWLGEHPSTVHWDRGRVSVDHVHGHEGATRIEWDNPWYVSPDLADVQARVTDCAQGHVEGWDPPTMVETLWRAVEHIQPLMAEVARLRTDLAATSATSRQVCDALAQIAAANPRPEQAQARALIGVAREALGVPAPVPAPATVALPVPERS